MRIIDIEPDDPGAEGAPWTAIDGEGNDAIKQKIANVVASGGAKNGDDFIRIGSTPEPVPRAARISEQRFISEPSLLSRSNEEEQINGFLRSWPATKTNLV